MGVNIAGDRAVEVQIASQVCYGGKRKRSVNVNAVPGRIVVFLRDVYLRVCLDSTRHSNPEDWDYGSQAYPVLRHRACVTLERHRRVV